MNRGFFRLALPSLFTLVSFFSIAHVNAQDMRTGNSDLLARQQIKTQQIESELRDLRGSISDDMQDVRARLSDIFARLDDNTAGEQQSIQKAIASLASLEDSISLLEQRMRRTIEMSSDLDFRIIRLENKMQTLLSLSSDTTPSSFSNSQNTKMQSSDEINSISDNISSLVSSNGSTWLIDQQKLDENLTNRAEDVVPFSGSIDTPSETQDQTSEVSLLEDTGNSQDNNKKLLSTETSKTLDDTVENNDENNKIYTLPEGTIEDQYNFAVKLALAKKLDEASQAFEAISKTYPDEPRAADSLFFLGRVQYMQKQFELAAYSFSEFNMNYPNDSRLVDSTLFLAKSVGEFAEPEQACPIFESLPELLEEKPQNFLTEMQLLSDKKQCQKAG